MQLFLTSRPNKSNLDNETSHFTGLDAQKKVQKYSYRRLFPHVGDWEKVFPGSMASLDVVIPLFGFYKLPAGLVWSVNMLAHVN